MGVLMSKKTPVTVVERLPHRQGWFIVLRGTNHVTHVWQPCGWCDIDPISSDGDIPFDCSDVFRFRFKTEAEAQSYLDEHWDVISSGKTEPWEQEPLDE